MKTNHYIKELIRYDINATSILEWYEEAFEGDLKTFDNFIKKISSTINAANNLIRDIEKKIRLMPKHMIEANTKEQNELWYKEVINNPISYSMDDITLETICSVVYAYWLDDERMKIARRGIVAKLVYNWFNAKDVDDKNTIHTPLSILPSVPQQEEANHKDKQAKNGIKGVASKTKEANFSDIIQYKNKEALLERLHFFIDGKGGVDAATIIVRATDIDKYLLRYPKQKEYESEFTLIGSWEAIRKNLCEPDNNMMDRLKNVIIFS